VLTKFNMNSIKSRHTTPKSSWMSWWRMSFCL